MKKFDILKSFKSNKFKYGGYATVLTIVVFAIVIALNLVVGQLDLKMDLTKKKLFSLSNESVQLLSKVNKDIKIYALYEQGKEDVAIKEVLNKYSAKSKKITVEFVNPLLHPEFTVKYAKPGENISMGSLIVEAKNKYKVINPEDLYLVSKQTQQVESSAVEEKVSLAINYVCTDKNTIAYVLQGHNETQLSDQVTKKLEAQNYMLKPIDMLANEWKPEKKDLLIINSPRRDISGEELTKIKDFLANNGRGMFFVDYTKDDLPNLKQLLKSYGLSIEKSIVIENDLNLTVGGNKTYLMPRMLDNAILNPIKNSKLAIVMVAAQPIVTLKERKNSLVIDQLLVTSESSFGKMDIASKTMEKEKSDLSGPFSLAVTVMDKKDYSDETNNPKLVVISTSSVAAGQLISTTKGANLDFLSNCFNWLAENNDGITVFTKTILQDNLVMTASAQLIVAGIAVILIPLIVVICGIIVWVRRRHL